ncbi:MAG: hypothetical protein ACO263_11350, partial [Cyclobacteriaceae bacterium]
MVNFKKSPGSLVFVPALYAVWSDLILSEKESRILEMSVDQQTWLSPDEKSSIREFLKPDAKIDPNLLNDWLSMVRQLKFKEQESLVTTGIRLARTINPTFDIPAESKAVFQKIEEQLGIPKGESPFIFFP